MKHPPCIECGKPSLLVTGGEVYPRRRDLWEKQIWRCPRCMAYVGCHPGTQDSLGYPAGPETRRARMLLHNDKLDPLWRKESAKKAGKPPPKLKRNDVYTFLARSLGIDREECHTGHFDIERCRDAWRALTVLEDQIADGVPVAEIFERLDPAVSAHRATIEDPLIEN